MIQFVKSKTEKEMVVDLQETFDNMRIYKMRLNPKKCVFGIKSGQFIGLLSQPKRYRCQSRKGSSNH